MSHRIVFTPSGLHGTVEYGATVLDAARALGVDLDSVCGGRGICGRCQVVVGQGEFSKWAIAAGPDAVSTPDSIENDYRGARPLRVGQRLGCGIRVQGDVVIDVPAESQIHKQVVRKGVNLDGLVVDPRITLHYLDLNDEVPAAVSGTSDGSGSDEDEQMVDGESGEAITTRVARHLAHDWGVQQVEFDMAVLPRLHASAPTMTVALRRDPNRTARRVTGVWPGFVDRVVGAAVDIGSTTVAGHLCDLTTGAILASAGRMNPQIRFGEDLMSRVSYVMMNSGGDRELTSAIRRALAELLDELLSQAGLQPDTLADVVLVGNPIMGHLVLGIDPTPLGQAPFPLATDRAVNGRAEEFELPAGPSIYFGPCIAGHVGADTAAAILAEKPHQGEAIQLLVDVGTNAEIVLGNRERLLAASSPTGPAFEGAQISAGQRATTGAIERVRIDRETLEPRFRIIGHDAWSDEHEFVEAAPTVTGICGSGIIEVMSELFLSGVIDSQGVITGANAAWTDRVEHDERTFRYRLADGIYITQADVRAIQLAKAALRAGIDLLLERAGIESVDEVRLAGAFGAHIDPVHAMVLGLIPDCDVDAVRSVGNSAGSGAVRALLSAAERAELEEVVRTVTKIETATEPRFQELFVAALAFPHLHASNVHLSKVVSLPEPTTTHPGPTGQRRRRRRPAGRANNLSTAKSQGSQPVPGGDGHDTRKGDSP